VNRLSSMAVLAAAVTLSGCQSPLAPSTANPVTGSWGGDHISLVVGATGGQLEYDCASGWIDGPLLTDAAGGFTAGGYHSPGHGGPERQGYEPPRLPAVYSGQIVGDVMTLTVKVPSTGIQIGPLTLRRDAQPMLMRCL
jgi:hypothetical protein